MPRDGITEPVSRDQILRRERGQGKIIFPVELTTSSIDSLAWLIHYFAICDDHTYMHTYMTFSGGTVYVSVDSFPLPPKPINDF